MSLNDLSYLLPDLKRLGNERDLAKALRSVALSFPCSALLGDARSKKLWHFSSNGCYRNISVLDAFKLLWSKDRTIALMLVEGPNGLQHMMPAEVWLPRENV